MGISGFPTSSDIYLEADGKKIAIVQSYNVLAKRTERTIEAFGESEPVVTIVGQPSYTIELTRLYATEAAVNDGIDFHTLSGFSLVIVKPEKRTIFTGCNWAKIAEDGQLNDMVAEKVTISAAKRVESSV